MADVFHPGATVKFLTLPFYDPLVNSSSPRELVGFVAIGFFEDNSGVDGTPVNANEEGWSGTSNDCDLTDDLSIPATFRPEEGGAGSWQVAVRASCCGGGDAITTHGWIPVEPGGRICGISGYVYRASGQIARISTLPKRVGYGVNFTDGHAGSTKPGEWERVGTTIFTGPTYNRNKDSVRTRWS